MISLAVSPIFLMFLDQDGAEPNPNSVSVQNLWRLAALVDKQEYKEMSEKVMAAFSGLLGEHPVVLPEMLCALINHYQSPKQVGGGGRGGGKCMCVCGGGKCMGVCVWGEVHVCVGGGSACVCVWGEVHGCVYGGKCMCVCVGKCMCVGGRGKCMCVCGVHVCVGVGWGSAWYMTDTITH